MPIDLLIGDKAIRRLLENLAPVEELETGWQADLDRFEKLGHEFHLYS
jgi:uncharacterized protein YbbC (DUF1343 family)